MLFKPNLIAYKGRGRVVQGTRAQAHHPVHTAPELCPLQKIQAYPSWLVGRAVVAVCGERRELRMIRTSPPGEEETWCGYLQHLKSYHLKINRPR